MDISPEIFPICLHRFSVRTAVLPDAGRMLESPDEAYPNRLWYLTPTSGQLLFHENQGYFESLQNGEPEQNTAPVTEELQEHA